MCKGGFHHKHAISYPVLFYLITVLSHCFAQNVYDYSDYSYRHGRDYQYEEEYVDDYDKTGTSGGGYGGGDGGLSPLAALIAPLAALALLGAASLISLNPTLLQLAVINGKRKRRRRRWADNEENDEYQSPEDKLNDEMQLFENFFAKQPHETIKNQTQELFANYIQCSGLSSEVDSDRHGKSQCLEHLVCLYANPVATIPYTNVPVDKAEKDVISIILYNLLSNNFIDEHIKSRVRVAARQSKYALESSRENHASAWCSVYKCHLIEEKFTQQSSSQKSSHRSHRYFYM